MAEAQRIASPLVPEARPRLAAKYAAPLRLPLDETQNLRPPVTVETVSLRQVQEMKTDGEDIFGPAKEPLAGRGRNRRVVTSSRS